MITPFETPCPAAGVAERMACLIRALKWTAPGGDDLPHTEVSREYLNTVIFQQVQALQEAVPALEVRSVKGALLKMYVAALDAYSIDSCFGSTDRSGTIADDVKTLEIRVWRGLRTAAAALEADHDDDDLRVIREHLCETEVEVDRLLGVLVTG